MNRLAALTAALSATTAAVVGVIADLAVFLAVNTLFGDVDAGRPSSAEPSTSPRLCEPLSTGRRTEPHTDRATVRSS